MIDNATFAANLKNTMRTADRLKAGSVWVNQYVNLLDGSPFGGYRGSGLGREYSAETFGCGWFEALGHMRERSRVDDLPPVPTTLVMRLRRGRRSGRGNRSQRATKHR